MANSVKVRIGGDDSGYQKSLKNIEKSTRSQAAKLAAEYRKQGMSQSEAMKKAWSEIERTSKEKTKKVKAGFKEEASESKTQSENIAKNYKSAFSTIGSVSAKGLGIIAKGTAVVSAGFGAATVASLNYAGELEQNIGGSEAVFKDYAQQMQDTAGAAFGNMGLSASDFLATANKMGALFQGSGFGIEESANLSAETMQRAADVASIMGIDVSEAMEAVAGAAKGNFTMMDNLGVAMNETTLNAYALEKGINKTTNEMTNQEKVALAMEMFLKKTSYAAGNYARENQTLAGSLTTAKAALENFMAGTGTTEQLVSSLTNAAQTIISKIGELAPELITGLTDAINQLIPSIPDLFQQLLPEFQNGFSSLFGGIMDIAPELLTIAGQLLATLLQGIIENADTIADGAVRIVMTLAEAIISNLPMIIETGLELIISLAEGLTDSLPELIPVAIDAVLTVVDTLLDNIDALVDAGIELTMSLADGLIEALPELIEKAPEIIEKLVNAIADNLPKLMAVGPTLILKLVEAIITNLPQLLTAAGEIIMTIANGVGTSVENIVQIGKDIVSGIWEGIRNAKDWIFGKIEEWVGSVVDWIKEKLGIRSPSRVMRDKVGAMITKGVAVGVEKEIPEAEKAMDKLLETMAKAGYEQALEFAKSSDEIWQLKHREVEGLLDAEKEYLAEKARIELENYEKEYREKLANAKDAAEIEEIKQERIKKEAEKGQEAYLNNLEMAAEREREIYEALQEDIENAKEKCVENFRALADSAFDSMEELEDAVSGFESKLRDSTSLFYTYSLPTLEINGESVTPTYAGLADLSKQTEKLEQYADNLDALKARGGVPQGILDEIRGLSVEEGMMYTNALLAADNEEFNRYIQGYERREEAISRISKKEFSKEAEELNREFEEMFGEVPADFWGVGADAAKNFGDAFIESLKTTLADVRGLISAAMSELSPQLGLAVSGGGNRISQVSNSYSPTFNIKGPYNQSTREEIKAQNLLTKFIMLRGD